jgi:hypothetical protein
LLSIAGRLSIARDIENTGLRVEARVLFRQIEVRATTEVAEGSLRSSRKRKEEVREVAVHQLRVRERLRPAGQFDPGNPKARNGQNQSIFDLLVI